MRLAPALKQLISEVEAYDADAEWEVTDEADGFGRHRQVTFGTATTKWLAPVMKLSTDRRLAEVRVKGRQKQLTVRFVPDTRADFRKPFDIAEAATTLHE